MMHRTVKRFKPGRSIRDVERQWARRAADGSRWRSAGFGQELLDPESACRNRSPTHSSSSFLHPPGGRALSASLSILTLVLVARPDAGATPPTNPPGTPHAKAMATPPLDCAPSPPVPFPSAHARVPAAGPTYVSQRSADVILSDVRPVKLRGDALRCINVLLDELLWAVLGAARALATERLNAGLRRVLPTALGKEALLEAELELRAYLERVPPQSPLPTQDEEEFHLTYAFDVSASRSAVFQHGSPESLRLL